MWKEINQQVIFFSKKCSIPEKFSTGFFRGQYPWNHCTHSQSRICMLKGSHGLKCKLDLALRHMQLIDDGWCQRINRQTVHLKTIYEISRVCMICTFHILHLASYASLYCIIFHFATEGDQTVKRKKRKSRGARTQCIILDDWPVSHYMFGHRMQDNMLQSDRQAEQFWS